MLELKFIRNNIEFLEEMLKNRGSSETLAEFEQLDAERRELLTNVETLKHKKNHASAEVARKKKRWSRRFRINIRNGTCKSKNKNL